MQLLHSRERAWRSRGYNVHGYMPGPVTKYQRSFSPVSSRYFVIVLYLLLNGVRTPPDDRAF